MDPDRQIADRWKTEVVVTSAGTIVTGVVVREVGEQLELLTAQGERVALARSEVEERRAEPKSLMPAGQAAQLTAQELADLLAWLGTLK